MLRQFSIRFRLTALIVLPLLVLIAVISLMLNRMSAPNQDIDSLYKDRGAPLRQIKIMSDSSVLPLLMLCTNSAVATCLRHSSAVLSVTQRWSFLRTAMMKLPASAVYSAK